MIGTVWTHQVVQNIWYQRTSSTIKCAFSTRIVRSSNVNYSRFAVLHLFWFLSCKSRLRFLHTVLPQAQQKIDETLLFNTFHQSILNTAVSCLKQGFRGSADQPKPCFKMKVDRWWTLRSLFFCTAHEVVCRSHSTVWQGFSSRLET